MKRWARGLRPETFLFASALFAAATPLSAQQAAAPAPAAQAVSAPATAPATSLPGPRVREEWRRVEPTIGENRESRMMFKSNQTITVSTLVLVLAVVILVLLIA